MEKYRFEKNELSHMAKSRMPFAIYQFVDKRVVTLLLSKGFFEMFGYDDEIKAYFDMDNDMYKETHPDDVQRISDAAFTFATQGGKYEVIYRSKRVDGVEGYKIIHAVGEHFFTEDGTRLALVWYMDEGPCDEDTEVGGMSLNKHFDNALHGESIVKFTNYDFLTGLPTMTHFFDISMVTRDKFLAEGKRPAMLFFDFRGMKYFNRRHGLPEGDKLLREFSRLLAEMYGNECCTRLGGDHFAVFTEEDGLEETVELIFKEGRKLNNGLSLPIHAGVYLSRGEDVGSSTAVDRAKLACDSIRRNYASSFKYYDDTMRDNEEKQQYILASFDRALEEKWITVYYQPIVRAVSGRVCDEEALARWIDPIRGFMSPGDFIPILEDAKQIYKLDLYVLDRVIEKLKIQESEGLFLVPQSINLSRSDFEVCDIVEEIRQRVDDSGIERKMFTIEITESIFGSDFNFMNDKIKEFKELGFPVWMDDFGSGYSSLDVLQSMDIDLLKFDMKFMRKFDQNQNSRIILSELMRMALSLGLDTICEGVETEEQAKFLREIGCSKIQGFYYAKPMPLEDILERYEKGIQIGFENPAQKEYYESIGRTNLHDLRVMSADEGENFQSVFESIPMAVIEFRNKKMRFARTNGSYREFMKRYFDFEMTDEFLEYQDAMKSMARSYERVVKEFARKGKKMFIDELLPDGSTAHFFLRRMVDDPVDNTVAITLAVLAIIDKGRGSKLSNLVSALAGDD